MPLPTEDIRRELSDLEKQGLRRRLEPRHQAAVDFSSNDYLGLRNDPALLEAARRALATSLGTGAARLVGGNEPAHEALETKVAQFKEREAALLFSSGYQANLGLITALVNAGDAIYSDALNHASIIDGCRLSRADIFVYRHCDAAALRELLETNARRYRRNLVVTDAIFGMDGDSAPLPAIAELAGQHGAMLVVDEAHATGVYGDQGRGLCHGAGVYADAVVVTFGKALGSFGAAVAGDQILVDYLVQRSRPFIYTTSLPAHLCAATSAAIDVLLSPQGEKLRARLWENVEFFANQLEAITERPRQRTVIQPLICGSSAVACEISHHLRSAGYFVQAIRPPTVPEGTSRLRCSVSAQHNLEQIEGLIREFRRYNFNM